MRICGKKEGKFAQSLSLYRKYVNEKVPVVKQVNRSKRKHSIERRFYGGSESKKKTNDKSP